MPSSGTGLDIPVHADGRDHGAGRRTGRRWRRNEPRDPIGRPEPESPGPVPERRGDDVVREAVRRREVPEAAAPGVEPVHAARRAEIDEPVPVVGDGVNAPRRRTLRRREALRREALRRRRVDPEPSRPAVGDPESPRPVEKEIVREALRRPLRGTEARETPVVPPDDPSGAEGDPEIPAVFEEGEGRRGRKAFLRAERLEAPRGPVEAGQRRRGVVDAGPERPARILEQRRDVISSQPVPRRVDGLRLCACERRRTGPRRSARGPRAWRPTTLPAGRGGPTGPRGGGLDAGASGRKWTARNAAPSKR